MSYPKSLSGVFNNSLSPIAVGRILFDRNRIKESTTQLHDIDELFFAWDETVVMPEYLQMIVGPIDTVYEGGFFFFEGTMPDNYPFAPMKMRCDTQGGRVRQHPNYYVEGKCCLSFLGTWAGPPWSACQNMISIAHTMKSIFTKNPLQNEPGYENVNNAKSQLYEDMVGYWVIKVAVCDMMNQRPKNSSTVSYDIFYPHMAEKFVKYYPTYLTNLEKYRIYDKQTIASPVYGFSIAFDIYSVLKELNLIHQRLKLSHPHLFPIPEPIPIPISTPVVEAEVAPMKTLYVKPVGTSKVVLKPLETKNKINIHELIISDSDSNENMHPEGLHEYIPMITKPSDSPAFNTPIPEPTVSPIIDCPPDMTNKQIDIKMPVPSKRGAPNAKSAGFPEGHIQVSENDGQKYIVKQYPSGMKRWVLHQS